MRSVTKAKKKKKKKFRDIEKGFLTMMNLVALMKFIKTHMEYVMKN